MNSPCSSLHPRFAGAMSQYSHTLDSSICHLPLPSRLPYRHILQRPPLPAHSIEGARISIARIVAHREIARWHPQVLIGLHALPHRPRPALQPPLHVQKLQRVADDAKDGAKDDELHGGPPHAPLEVLAHTVTVIPQLP